MFVYTASRFSRAAYGTGGTTFVMGIFSSYDTAIDAARKILAGDQWSSVTIVEHVLDDAPTGNRWFVKNVDGELQVS